MRQQIFSNVYDSTGRRTNVADILADAQAARFVIQDFCPLAESIEWKLGQCYLERGSKAFSGDWPIPFAMAFPWMVQHRIHLARLGIT